MVTNVDGQDAYVTADPTPEQKGQRAMPLHTAPVMDTCADVRSSRPTDGGVIDADNQAAAQQLRAARDTDLRERLAEEKARVDELAEAVRKLAAVNAWQQFGECRAWGEGPILSPKKADELARRVLRVCPK